MDSGPLFLNILSDLSCNSCVSYTFTETCSVPTISAFDETSSIGNNKEECPELRRGPWTLEEDTLLAKFISCHGQGRWNMLANNSGLRRTRKSCRMRWLNYLKPGVKRGDLSPQEQLLILELHSRWGNSSYAAFLFLGVRWSKVAECLPGRTNNEIKNYWGTQVLKQARLLKIDPNNIVFQDIVRSQ